MNRVFFAFEEVKEWPWVRGQLDMKGDRIGTRAKFEVLASLEL